MPTLIGFPSRILRHSLRPKSMNPYSTTGGGSPSPTGAYTAEAYARKADHTPQTAQPESEIYVLTLNTDAEHHKRVTDLRTKYFPPNLNKLSAHITLFRALPGSKLPMIQEAIQDVVQQYHPFFVSTGAPFMLAHGVGLVVRADPAQEIFQALKERWISFLSKQDHSFRPHYTIQNKVEDRSIVEKTSDEIRGTFTGSRGTANGLTLHLYYKGYWAPKQFYPFPPEEDQQHAPSMNKTDEADWPALPSTKAST